VILPQDDEFDLVGISKAEVFEGFDGRGPVRCRVGVLLKPWPKRLCSARMGFPSLQSSRLRADPRQNRLSTLKEVRRIAATPRRNEDRNHRV